LIIAAIGWPALLVATGVAISGWDLVGAAALATLNTLVGVAVHQGILRLFRIVVSRQGSPGSG
jgi:hypothetical protein